MIIICVAIAVLCFGCSPTISNHIKDSQHTQSWMYCSVLQQVQTDSPITFLPFVLLTDVVSHNDTNTKKHKHRHKHKYKYSLSVSLFVPLSLIISDLHFLHCYSSSYSPFYSPFLLLSYRFLAIPFSHNSFINLLSSNFHISSLLYHSLFSHVFLLYLTTVLLLPLHLLI